MLFIICYEGEEVGQIRYNIDKTLGKKLLGKYEYNRKNAGKGIGM